MSIASWKRPVALCVSFVVSRQLGSLLFDAQSICGAVGLKMDEGLKVAHRPIPVSTSGLTTSCTDKELPGDFRAAQT